MLSIKRLMRAGIVALWLIATLSQVACGKTNSTETKTIILGAYTVPKEAYQKIIPAFQKYWKEKTGEDVIFKESYVASGAQARAICGGFEADIAALSLEGDIEQIVKAGLITHDWKGTQTGGMVTNSVVVIGVREGNPRNIRDWKDLLGPGISVLYPNPKTSGGAMWGVNAIYGSALKYSEEKEGKPNYHYAREFLKLVQGKVKVMDKSGRESFSTFEQGIGDAVVTYENEIIRAIAEGQKFEIVYPQSTILIENPVAIIDKNVDKHGNREVVEAFAAFLLSEEAQLIFAENGFRPLHQQVAKDYQEKYPEPRLLFDTSYLGGWEKILNTLYGSDGIWTKILEELARE